MTTTAIFGAGVMGETLVSGLIRSGRTPGDLVVTGRTPDKVNALAERHGVRVMANAEAADVADTLVLCVKPQDMAALLDEIRDHVRARQRRRVARRRHHDRVPRVAAARGHVGRPRHAQHAGPRRPGHGRHLARQPLHRRPPRRGRGAAQLVRQGRAAAPRSTSTPSPRSPAAARPTSSTSSRR